MIFTNEQLAKAKQAKSEEELLTLARENGVVLAEEEAEKYFAELHKEGEISDEELDNVAGGFCENYERPASVQIGRAPDGAAVCPQCMGGLSYGYSQTDPNGDKFDPVSCYHCQLNFRHYWIGDTWTEA